MYFYLRGKITLHQKGSIVVDVNGVGYQVLVSHPEDYPLGETMVVYTVFFVREDEQYLVGFKTFEEKALFSKLISVKGVGPRTAIQALGSSSVDKLTEAINSSNLLYLTSLQGVGKKVASQIVLDLRGKLMMDKTKSGDKELDDAMDGLLQFGFTKKEITEVFSSISSRGLKAEEYIALALPKLSSRNKVK
ncbi:MAG: Holliday junction branch migration protein RuvA [Bacilli bacterium]|nr:Holliday junction branch migration protein RuvA [Bacilli bacterium]